MGTVATVGNGGDFPVLEPGTYAARCYGVIDIGTQRGEYQGEVNYKHQVIILFEASHELMEDGRPYGISAFRTLSLHESSKLRPELEAWRGKAFTEGELEGFDIANLIGHACMLTVVHNAKGKPKVDGISKPVKGMDIPPVVNPTVHFDLDKYLERDMNEAAKYSALPEWIRNKINDAREVHEPRDDEPMPDDNRGDDTIDPDDIPF